MAIEFNSKCGNQYVAFSNFHYAPFSLDGHTWPTVEHYYQAQKADTEKYRTRIRTAPTPQKAKRLGKKVCLQVGWNAMKIEVMRTALTAKFADPDLRNLLLSTGRETLVENSSWDDFWGSGKDGQGQNHMGKLLMELRNSIQPENPPSADQNPPIEEVTMTSQQSIHNFAENEAQRLLNEAKTLSEPKSPETNMKEPQAPQDPQAPQTTKKTNPLDVLFQTPEQPANTKQVPNGVKPHPDTANVEQLGADGLPLKFAAKAKAEELFRPKQEPLPFEAPIMPTAFQTELPFPGTTNAKAEDDEYLEPNGSEDYQPTDYDESQSTDYGDYQPADYDESQSTDYGDYQFTDCDESQSTDDNPGSIPVMPPTAPDTTMLDTTMLDTLRAEITSLKESFAKVTAQLTEQETVTKRENYDLKVEITVHKAALTDLTATTNNLTSEIASLKAALMEVTATTNKLTSEITNLKAENAKLKNHVLKTLQPRIATALAERDARLTALEKQPRSAPTKAPASGWGKAPAKTKPVIDVSRITITPEQAAQNYPPKVGDSKAVAAIKTEIDELKATLENNHRYQQSLGEADRPGAFKKYVKPIQDQLNGLNRKLRDTHLAEQASRESYIASIRHAWSQAHAAFIAQQR